MEFEDTSGRPNKTALKREAQDKHDLGRKLVAYPKAVLAKLTLDEDLRYAINLAQTITAHGGKRRQLQLIAKKLRHAEIETIEDEIARLEMGLPLGSAEPKEPKVDLIQPWMDRFQQDGDNTIAALLDDGYALDRQHIRQLVRNFVKTPKADSKAHKALRKYLVGLKVS